MSQIRFRNAVATLSDGNNLRLLDLQISTGEDKIFFRATLFSGAAPQGVTTQVGTEPLSAYLAEEPEHFNDIPFEGWVARKYVAATYEGVSMTDIGYF